MLSDTHSFLQRTEFLKNAFQGPEEELSSLLRGLTSFKVKVVESKTVIEPITKPAVAESQLAKLVEKCHNGNYNEQVCESVQYVIT